MLDPIGLKVAQNSRNRASNVVLFIRNSISKVDPQYRW